MGDTNQKIPLAKSLQEIMRQKALDHLHLTGHGLPCSIVAIKGAIATVKFEVGGGYALPNVIMPIAEALYNYGAHQVGDKGHALPNAANHGNMSGLGPSGAPGLAQPANLSALSFHPLGNTSWPDTGGKRVIQGALGAIAQTLDLKNQVAALPGKVLLKAGGVSTVLTPQMIALLAKLLGGSVAGGGANGGGPADYIDQATGNSAMNELVLAYQYAQPTTGATVAIATGSVVTTIDPVGALAALTVAFPATPDDGQVQFLSITQAVTTLTLTAGATIMNAPTSAVSGGSHWTFQYQVAAGKWFLI